MLERFATRYRYLAPLFLRLGLAAVFFLFSFQKLSRPDQGTGEIQLFLNLGLGPASLVNYYLGLAEGIVALSFLLGAGVRYTGIFAVALIVTFFSGLVSKYGINQDPTLNRDLGLAGGALALWLLGPGPFSLDAWLGKRAGKALPQPMPPGQPTDTQEKEPAPELPPPGVLQ